MNNVEKIILIATDFNTISAILDRYNVHADDKTKINEIIARMMETITLVDVC